MKTTQIKLSELVEDFDIYPRCAVDSQHVAHIVSAIEAGAELPPPIVENRTKRIVDGFHRCRAHRRLFGDDAQIDVVLKDYESDKDLFTDAMLLNSSHGRNMSRYDRSHAIARALEMRIPAKLIADVLHMKVEQVKQNDVTSMARIERSSQMVPIKRVIAHKAGGTVTRAQADVIPHLQGPPATFLVNQLLLLLRNDLLDASDEQLRELLVTLRSELSTYLKQ